MINLITTHIIFISIMKTKITIGVSSCLLGNNVRWEGDHNANKIIINQIGRYFELYPICPEVEIGMGVPREPVNLEGDKDNPSMIAKYSRKEWTSEMKKYSREKIAQFNKERISGFILKSNSPSCGLAKIPIYGNIGRPPKAGIGLFAKAIMRYNEFIPIVDEKPINDKNLRNLFIARSYIFHDLKRLFKKKLARNRLNKFVDDYSDIFSTGDIGNTENIKNIVISARDLGSPRFKQQFYSSVMRLLNTKNTDNILNYIESKNL